MPCQHAPLHPPALTCLAFSSLRRSSSRNLDTSQSMCSALPFATESGIFLACSCSGLGDRAGCIGDDTISTARRLCCPSTCRNYSSRCATGLTDTR